jgi:hypothetical protein
MSSRRSILLIVVVAIWTLAACNWTVGECWRRGEGSEGTGAGPGDGSIVLSSGSGDFYAAPPDEPQYGAEPPLECNKRDESSEESPPDSPERATESPCQGVGDTAGDGQTYVYCSDTCSSKCPPAGVNGFSAAIFKFVTTIPDDGTGESGGWQKASVRLKIKRLAFAGLESWECPEMTFGMPLRNSAQGHIPADIAARISASVATKASRKVMKENLTIPQGIYCARLKDEMDVSLKKRVAGSRVTQP